MDKLLQLLSRYFNYPIVQIQRIYCTYMGHELYTCCPEYGIAVGGVMDEISLDQNQYQIVGIINMCDEWEDQSLIDTLWLRCIDTFEPTVMNMLQAVLFIESKLQFLDTDDSFNKLVYIHLI